MIRKIVEVSLVCGVLCGAAACGGDKTSSQQDPADSQIPADSVRQTEKSQELNQTYTAGLNGRQYDIRLKRTSAVDLPQIKDEFGTSFYDNRVEMQIACDGKTVLEHTFTKESFQNELSAGEKQGTVLLGMAYDAAHTEGNQLCFGAQIGSVGLDEGPAFRVKVRLPGGQITIERDAEQDTTGDASLEE